MAYIPFIRRNLISVLILDRLGYSFLFGNGKVKLYQYSLLNGNGTLCGNVYILELYGLPFVYVSIDSNSSTKCLRLNEKSSTIWHKRLGHVSRQRMERLIKDEILPDLDFSYLDTCVDSIKGKMTAKIRNVKVDRCSELLKVTHTYICGSFTPLAMGGHKYFIKFIDDYPNMVLSSSFVRSLNL